MEKLHKRSDGFAETPSGLFAVQPKYAQKALNGVSWFAFHPSTTSPVIRVEWPEGSPLIIIEPETAASMVRLGFAAQVPEDMVEEYNEAVDSYNASQAKLSGDKVSSDADDAAELAALEAASALADKEAKEAAEAAAAADKAAADKAAADKAAADKAAADKAAADKAAADKIAADEKEAADKKAADDKAAADKLAAEKAAKKGK